MFHYQYRWVYAGMVFIFILVFGFFYDIKPLKNQLNHLTKNKNQLTKQLSMLRISEKNKTKPPSFTIIKPSESMTQFLELVHGSGITLVAMHAGETDSTNFNFKGDYLQLSSFMLNAHQQLPALLIKNFSYEVADQNKLMLSIQVEFAQMIEAQTRQPIQKKLAHNPFCQTAFISANLQKYSVKQLKMVGFLQENERQAALILLPDHQMILAQVGTYLGKERGLVRAINNQQVLILLSHQNKFILKK